MRRKSLLAAVPCVTVLLLVAFSSVRGDFPRPSPAPSGRVTLDGSSFLPDDTGQDDFSPVRREFEKFGVEALPDSGGSPGERREHPAFRRRLVGVEGSPSGDTPALPRGLTAEHVLRIESPKGPVNLVLGRMDVRGPSSRLRLVADGWESPGEGEAAGPVWLLEKRTGKETTIVCLDETEGTFLLLREGSW